MTHWFDLTSQPSAEEEKAVRDALWAANAEAGHPWERKGLTLPLRDAAGTVVGGLLGATAWRWCYIENLAVPPALRGAGWGRKLMAAAEAEARRRGCIGIRLDTYSFQARGFYEKLGFAVIGQIEDCPPGQTRFSMTKRLDAPGPVAIPWPDAAAPRATIAPGGASLVPVLLAGLSTHSVAQAGPHGHAPFSLAVHAPDEAQPAGGLYGYSFFNWMFIQYFFLPEALRGQGLGRLLMQRAEEEARARGCAGIWLDTFSFQALPFYESLGYRQFGRLDDFPPGHSRHYLMKRLTDGET
ncbi:GNAT family N-acetyltransferase [Falsiroseomonas tokyonensis]|uniref:GNAT family N-acetyltransferase n=1 Tax=Falsiroseomonas tokyonensis TaxID=430521 RepID=A0ABV7BQ80_9PROT|nr:GNAT family N-acetyltransferase [Falsiroseomonas tokyonensis]